MSTCAHYFEISHVYESTCTEAHIVSFSAKVINDWLSLKKIPRNRQVGWRGKAREQRPCAAPREKRAKRQVASLALRMDDFLCFTVRSNEIYPGSLGSM